MTRKWRLRLLQASILSMCLVGSAEAAQDSAVSRAEKLREAGEFAAAVSLLEAHLAKSPDDGAAARLLAQTLYWMGDWPRARRVYEAARARHPKDERLRLELGRMLAETGDTAAARRLLSPLPTAPQARADVLALLGTLEYWRGDLAAAMRLFFAALQANPAQPDAQRLLLEIRVATAPWIRVSPTWWHDDQPIDRAGATLEAGWFATPVTAILVRVQPSRYTTGDLAHAIWAAEGEFRHFVPDLRLETEITVGSLRRTIATVRSADWTGRAAFGLRLLSGVTLRGRTERSAYLSTASSLDTPVMVRTIAGELQWNSPRGWLGQAAVQRQTYPDANVISTTYGWLLAPITRQRTVDVHAGYAFGVDDARESRFVPALSESEPGERPGRYEPYYTPAEVVKHSAAAAVTVRLGPQAIVRISGSRAIHATEAAPILSDDGVRVQPVFVSRTFSAWEGRASVEMRTSSALSVTIATEGGRGAFYRWLSAGIHLTYRFVSTAPSGSGTTR